MALTVGLQVLLTALFMLLWLTWLAVSIQVLVVLDLGACAANSAMCVVLALLLGSASIPFSLVNVGTLAHSGKCYFTCAPLDMATAAIALAAGTVLLMPASVACSHSLDATSTAVLRADATIAAAATALRAARRLYSRTGVE